MPYDVEAQKLAVKVIGTVESNLKYDAVNYNDPITVGAFQWYGPRAAAILQRIGASSGTAWDGMAASLEADLSDYPVYSHSSVDDTVELPESVEIIKDPYDSGIPEYEFDEETYPLDPEDSNSPIGDAVPDYDPGDAPTGGVAPKTTRFWQGRHLTRKEGDSIKPILFANQAIQNAQAIEDFDSYVEIAEKKHLNIDTNTKTLIYFMCMYHQSPKQALAVLAKASPDASIDRMHEYCQKNDVLKKYKTRYNTALAMIKSGDTSGIILDGNTGTPGDSDEEPSDPGDSDELGTLAYIRLQGSQLHVYDRNGGHLVGMPTGGDYWTFSANLENNNVGTVPVPPEDEPGSLTLGEAAVKWMMDHRGTYKYSQGGARLKPDTSGYTDCSGCVWYCFKKVAGIDIGTYTTPQSKKGRLITTNREDIRAGKGLQPGDLIFYHAYVRKGWPFNHVEMYTGDSQRRTIGQVGSDDPGPNLHPMNKYLSWGKLNVMARRYV